MTRQCSQGRPAPGVHPVPVVHPVLKHTDDVHNHNSIEASKPTGDIHTPSSIEGNRSHDCTMELSRDAPQSPDPDVEFVCETLGPVTATLNQRLSLKQTAVTETDSTCGMKDSDSAGRPAAAARQRDGGNLSDEVVKGPSNTTQDSFLENGRASQKTHTDATQDPGMEYSYSYLYSYLLEYFFSVLSCTLYLAKFTSTCTRIYLSTVTKTLVLMSTLRVLLSPFLISIR